jgi:hypothetical protein
LHKTLAGKHYHDGADHSLRTNQPCCVSPEDKMDADEKLNGISWKKRDRPYLLVIRVNIREMPRILIILD